VPPSILPGARGAIGGSMIKLDKIEDQKDYKKMANVIQDYVLHGFSGEGEAPYLTLDPDQVRELWWISLRIQEI
tara:strand:- start:2782 stop:3003 length:222 start_codon:yes stop_codon:yes gene_type:complete